jgi:hypothetical protein
MCPSILFVFVGLVFFALPATEASLEAPATRNLQELISALLADGLCIGDAETRQLCVLQTALGAGGASLPSEILSALDSVKAATSDAKLLYAFGALAQGKSLIDAARASASKKVKQNAAEATLLNAKKTVQAFLDMDSFTDNDMISIRDALLQAQAFVTQFLGFCLGILLLLFLYFACLCDTQQPQQQQTQQQQQQHRQQQQHQQQQLLQLTT